MNFIRLNNYISAIGYASWMRSLSFVFVLFIVLSFSSSSTAEESGLAEGDSVVKIFYPAPNTLFNNELAHLIAKVSGKGAAYAVIRVNEQITPVIDLTDEAYKAVLKDTLAVRLYFLPGENELELTVKAMDGKLLESSKMMLYYRDSFSNDTSAIPEQYAIRPMHTPNSGEFCRGCHRMNVDPVFDIEPDKKYDLFCVKCHEAGLLSGRPHGTATWRCLACHKTGGDPLYSVKDAEGKFCLDCHSEEVERFKGMKIVHSNVKDIKCRSCHRLHNTQEDGLLPLAVNKLCFECHENVYTGKHITPGHPLEARSDPSREGRAFDCTSCHDPHASDITALLKHEPGMMMCKVCHSK